MLTESVDCISMLMKRFVSSWFHELIISFWILLLETALCFTFFGTLVGVWNIWFVVFALLAALFVTYVVTLVAHFGNRPYLYLSYPVFHITISVLMLAFSVFYMLSHTSNIFHRSPIGTDQSVFGSQSHELAHVKFTPVSQMDFDALMVVLVVVVCSLSDIFVSIRLMFRYLNWRRNTRVQINPANGKHRYQRAIVNELALPCHSTHSSTNYIIESVRPTPNGTETTL